MPTTAPTGDVSALARWLVDGLGDPVAQLGHPIWMQVLDQAGDDLTVAMSPDDFDPLGWVAPPECQAIGMVATGRVRCLDESAEPPAGVASARSGGARMACVVGRDGRTGWHMALPDGSVLAEVPEDGRMLDILRRCLELPTAPPPAGTGRLSCSSWLGAIRRAARPGQLLSWTQVLDLHPVFVEADGPLSAAVREAVIGAVSNAFDWDLVRQAAIASPDGLGLVDPGLARWMDEGMFARWVLDKLRPVDDMIASVRPFLRPGAARRLAHAVRAAA